MSYGTCWDEHEHRRDARRDAKYGRRDREYYDRYSDDPCKIAYTEEYRSAERRIEQQRYDQAEEERRQEQASYQRRQREQEEEYYYEAQQQQQEREEAYYMRQYEEPLAIFDEFCRMLGGAK